MHSASEGPGHGVHCEASGNAPDWFPACRLISSCGEVPPGRSARDPWGLALPCLGLGSGDQRVAAPAAHPPCKPPRRGRCQLPSSAVVSLYKDANPRRTRLRPGWSWQRYRSLLAGRGTWAVAWIMSMRCPDGVTRQVWRDAAGVPPNRITPDSAAGAHYSNRMRHVSLPLSDYNLGTGR